DEAFAAGTDFDVMNVHRLLVAIAKTDHAAGQRGNVEITVRAEGHVGGATDLIRGYHEGRPLVLAVHFFQGDPHDGRAGAVAGVADEHLAGKWAELAARGVGCGVRRTLAAIVREPDGRLAVRIFPFRQRGRSRVRVAVKVALLDVGQLANLN